MFVARTVVVVQVGHEEFPPHHRNPARRIHPLAPGVAGIQTISHRFGVGAFDHLRQFPPGADAVGEIFHADPDAAPGRIFPGQMQIFHGQLDDGVEGIPALKPLQFPLIPPCGKAPERLAEVNHHGGCRQIGRPLQAALEMFQHSPLIAPRLGTGGNMGVVLIRAQSAPAQHLPDMPRLAVRIKIGILLQMIAGGHHLSDAEFAHHVHLTLQVRFGPSPDFLSIPYHAPDRIGKFEKSSRLVHLKIPS